MTLDCLIDRSGNFSDVTVSHETYVDIEHCLLGHKQIRAQINGSRSPSAATPSHLSDSSNRISPTTSKDFLTDLGHVTDVFSHPQAFGQCSSFLSTSLKSAEQHETSSTSEAASRIARDDSGTAAAISSKLAAQMYGLDIFASAIQDQKGNTTRFLVIQKGVPSQWHFATKDDAKWKALVRFAINHESASALADALHVFKHHQLNLTSINSRPIRARPWHYIFLVECEYFGSSEKASQQIDVALTNLSQVTEGYKFLGKWRG